MKFTTCVDLGVDTELSNDELLLLDLHLLVGKGKLKTLKKIAAQKPELFKKYLNQPLAETGKTLLMSALSAGCPKIKTDAAVLKIKRKMAYFLITKCKADLRARDAVGQTCLYDAVQSDDIKLVVYVLDNVYHQAHAFFSHETANKILVDFVNSKNNAGQTACDYALQIKSAESKIAKTLLLASKLETLGQYSGETAFINLEADI